MDRMLPYGLSHTALHSSELHTEDPVIAVEDLPLLALSKQSPKHQIISCSKARQNTANTMNDCKQSSVLSSNIIESSVSVKLYLMICMDWAWQVDILSKLI
jgi:hypothetical protein